jgi:hypothetical protein
VNKFLLILGFLLGPSQAVLAEEKIALIPPSAYDRASIYLNLALFWVALIVLIVLIRLKLREIERVQVMDAGRDDENIPMLD